MINDEVLDKVIERIVDRVEKANRYILKAIGDSIKEIGTINPTKLNQLIMSLKYGSNYKSILRELSKYTKISQKEINEIFEEVAKSDYKFAKQFYEYRDRPYVPFNQNKELVEQTKELAKLTANECINLTKTSALGFGIPGKDGNIVYHGIKETYYDLLDEAVLSVAQGKETFNSAMYRQLKNIAESGLKVVYPTTYIDKYGIERHYTRRLDSAIRMNLKSGLRQLHNETQKTIGEQIDADGVEVSVHFNPAEDHAEVQGKQFTNKEFDKLQSTGVAKTYDGIKINMHRELKDGSDAISFRPISEYNCYHYIFSIVLGVNRPQYTNEQLKKINEDNEKGFEFEGEHYTMYEGTQLQRQIETEIRKQKEAQLLGNEELNLESQKKIRVLSKKYKELCKASGLLPRADRMRI